MADHEERRTQGRRSQFTALPCRGLNGIQDEFPCFRIRQEFAGQQVRYVARRAGPGPGLHTVVTADLAELRAALSAGSEHDPQPDEYPQVIADEYPGWGVRWRGGRWTAWCPAITVHAATAGALRALIEHAISGDAPDWDDPC